MAHKDFALAPAVKDPPSFTVAGHAFACLTEPPAGVITDLVAAAEGSVSAQTNGIIGFIEGCLTDADADAFRAAIHDKNVIVPLETLRDIANWLLEQYMPDRPTTPSSFSPPGSSPDAATSEGGSSSPVSTPVLSGL